jgi:tetratricopeptide (TPR) repeat protein
MQYALDPKLLPPGGVPVQCSRCSHVFTAAPPAQANANTTQLFGPAVPSIAPVQLPVKPAAKPAQPAAKPAQPAVNSTLLFGTSGQGPAPSVATTSNKPKAAPAGTSPSAVTTQVFGAVPVPPPAGKPPAGNAPAPQTTQVFGAVPPEGLTAPSTSTPAVAPQARPPSASTTPPLGTQSTSPATGPSLAGRPSSVSLVELFGDLPDFEFEQPAQQPAQPSPPTQVAQPDPVVAPTPSATPSLAQLFDEPAPMSVAPLTQPPGLMPRISPPEPLASPAPIPAPVGVAAGTPIELPDEPPAPSVNPFTSPVPSPAIPSLADSSNPLADLVVDEAPEAPVPSLVPATPAVPALPKPLELPPELLDNSRLNVPSEDRDTRPNKGRTSRNLLIAALVIVLALTAFLTSPAWLGKSNALSREALVAKEDARGLLRRDDTTSKEEALTRFRGLVGQYPTNVEVQAERAIALAMNLDDMRVQMGLVESKVKRLQARITELTDAKAPADWEIRVNAMREEVSIAQRELVPLQERTARLVQEALNVSKQLAAIPPQEEKEPALARLRARALLGAALGATETTSLAVQLAQSQQQDWSSLVMAEYVLNASTSPNQVRDVGDALKQLLETDKTWLRLYVLDARHALLRGEPTAALATLESVLTLNPKHELAQKLQKHARELLDQGSESSVSP